MGQHENREGYCGAFPLNKQNRNNHAARQSLRLGLVREFSLSLFHLPACELEEGWLRSSAAGCAVEVAILSLFLFYESLLPKTETRRARLPLRLAAPALSLSFTQSMKRAPKGLNEMH